MVSTSPAHTLALNDLARSADALAGETARALLRVAASGWYLRGREVAAFERELAAFVGTAFAIGVASGTDALELALLAVGCEPGDEVVIAANAGGYATMAALHAGLRPRYADVDPQTLCLSRESVAAALSDAASAVVVTHLYGRLAGVEAIAALCAERRVALVEDCAQAIGARRAGCAAGAFGDAAAFSFYPTKNLGAIGDAGAVLTDRADVAERVRSLGQYGWEEKYRVVRAGGSNSRMDELQAAVLRVRLPHLPAWNARRREIVARYAAALRPAAGTFVVGDGEDHVCHLAVLLATNRAAARERLAAAGVGSDVHYPVPDHRQPAWAAAHRAVSLPVTEAAADRVLTVPCFPELTEAEVERVCGALREL
jgi:dTDP-4-amino-4,6-dideoxygalactose transaminase